ncbi:hypothetical protein L208DRAFT_1399770 [Tricholoma matsutake]|nr:hypothetical protein L208DRAFT_1399770 [Tricholoma matsutake 945]
MHLLPLASTIFFTTLAVFGYEWLTSPSPELINSMANRFLENPAICPVGVEIRLKEIEGPKLTHYEAKKIIRFGQAIERKYTLGAKCINYNHQNMGYKKCTARFEWKGSGDNQELLKADISEITPISRMHFTGWAIKEKEKKEKKLQGTHGDAGTSSMRMNEDAGTGSMRMNEGAGTSSMRMNEGAGTSSMRMNEGAGTSSMRMNEDAGTGSMRMNEDAGTGSMRMNEGAGTGSMRMKLPYILNNPRP